MGIAPSAGYAAKPEAPVIAATSQRLVIEAEDLGMAHTIDKASFEALEKGWVTSAGVLVPGPWFPEAVRWARSHPNDELGIQLDLNAEWASYRWRAIAAQQGGSGLVDPAGYLPMNAQYIGQHAKPEDVAAEFRSQIDNAKYTQLPINHLDSHRGIVLYTPWLFREYWKAATDSGLPAVPSMMKLMNVATTTMSRACLKIGSLRLTSGKNEGTCW